AAGWPGRCWTRRWPGWRRWAWPSPTSSCCATRPRRWPSGRPSPAGASARTSRCVPRRDDSEMKLLRCVLLILACAWLNGAAALQPGERLAPWTLLDQFDRPYSLDQSLQVLLVARGMEASERLQEALAELAPGFLERHRVTFLADISGMPR